MKRVLVTGATGFIGRHCLAPLAAHGYEVHAVTSKHRLGGDRIATWHQADLLDRGQIAPLLEKVAPTHLLHLAWVVDPGVAYFSQDNFRWVQSTLELTKEFARCGGKRMAVAGTCYEYDQTYGVCSEERTPTRPNTTYGTCKNALRELLASYCESLDLSFAWPRIFFLYGPGEHPGRLVSSVANALLRGEPAKCSHGRQLRDFLYVEDLGEALAALLKSEVQGPINLGQGSAVELREIVSKLGELAGRPDLIRLGAIAARENEVPVVMADTTQMKRQLDWTPRFDLETGLQRTLDWWEEQLKTEQTTGTV
ncbi:MAG: NAD(P)-dependent oxidoreductase [Planctomycetes bacterium]|nr:NAD(P)-dependent oxidoreductase [Planctomycetota bacterium]